MIYVYVALLLLAMVCLLIGLGEHKKALLGAAPVLFAAAMILLYLKRSWGLW